MKNYIKSVIILSVVCILAILLTSGAFSTAETLISDNSKAGILHTVNGKININKADSKTLESLPGIGETTAFMIIQYRLDNGDFIAVEDLMKVSGIGQKKFDAIKELITV